MALFAQQHHCSFASAYCEVTVNNGAHHICLWEKCGWVLQLQAVLLPQSPHDLNIDRCRHPEINSLAWIVAKISCSSRGHFKGIYWFHHSLNVVFKHFLLNGCAEQWFLTWGRPTGARLLILKTAFPDIALICLWVCPQWFWAKLGHQCLRSEVWDWSPGYSISMYPVCITVATT